MGATPPPTPKSRRRSPAQPRRGGRRPAPRPQIAQDERIGVAHLTAEYWPFARTGGLGEAVSGLATCQAAAGLPTTVFMPLYQIVRETTPSLERRAGALERRRGLANDLVQRHENGGRQACGGLAGRQTAHGLAQPTGAGEGAVLSRQVGDTDPLIWSDLGPRRRGGRRPARLGRGPPPGLRDWWCRAHLRLHWLAHSGRRRIVRRLLPPHRGEVVLRDIIPDHALGGEPRSAWSGIMS